MIGPQKQLKTTPQSQQFLIHMSVPIFTFREYSYYTFCHFMLFQIRKHHTFRIQNRNGVSSAIRNSVVITLLKFLEKKSEWLRLGQVPVFGDYIERKGTVMISFMCPFA